MNRILLADDHPMIRTAIEALLRGTEFEMAGTSATESETLRQIDELKPDILLLDLQMPEGSGMGVLRHMRRNAWPPQVILLTAAIDDASLVEANTLGVVGMVLKNSDPAYLLECLGAVKSGGSWFDPELSDRLTELGDTLKERPQLAPRERELIRFVAKGLRNREIARELGITEGTVKVYLHALFEKVDVSSRTEFAVRAGEILAASYLGS